LFWENGKAVLRKLVGMPISIERVEKRNPNTYTIDTGDMFQGSELSVETTGAAFVPILNALDYNLFYLGTGKFGKKRMQTLLGSLNAQKYVQICTTI
jgi:2',3'-cyclic-nucleotide 2'-phosphodiesterase (5'-nucleotidase family)